MKARTYGGLALLLIALGGAAGLALGLPRLLGALRPYATDVSERFVVYVEGMSPSGKLVLVESVQRLTASKEFTMRVLSIVALQASIKVTALADVAYVVDLADPRGWRATWQPASGRLVIRAPRPDCLPPAVRTDTVEVDTEGANLLSSAVFRIRSEVEKLRADLSKDFLAQSRQVLQTKELRERMASSLEASARAFGENVLGVRPRTVEVLFPAVADAP